MQLVARVIRWCHKWELGLEANSESWNLLWTVNS